MCWRMADGSVCLGNEGMLNGNLLVLRRISPNLGGKLAILWQKRRIKKPVYSRKKIFKIEKNMSLEIICIEIWRISPVKSQICQKMWIYKKNLLNFLQFFDEILQIILIFRWKNSISFNQITSLPKKIVKFTPNSFIWKIFDRKSS